MDTALAGHDMPESTRSHLRARLHDLADHMRNQPG
jgi:hypothetical protein